MKTFGDVQLGDTVTLRYQDKWSHTGHLINSGMASPDGKLFYVNIPKNNSSYVKKKLNALGWTYESIEDYPEATPIIILRDPVNRWVSGIAEYLAMYQIDTLDHYGFYSDEAGYAGLFGQPLAINLMLRHVTFDDHTEKQVMFLQGVNSLSKALYFKSDNTFTDTFNSFLQEQGYDHSIVDDTRENDNSSSANQRRNSIKTFFKNYLELYPNWKLHLRHYFSADQHLINTSKFYESR